MLTRYLGHCRARGYLAPLPRRAPPAWWSEPIYCTWHDQVALSLRAAERERPAAVFVVFGTLSGYK